MRGRKRLPTQLHLLKNSYRADRHGGRDPRPPDDGAKLEPWDWLSERQKEIWRETVAHAPRGVLHAIDAGLLTAFVTAAHMHEVAACMQNKLDAATSLPLLVKDAEGGVAVSPYVTIMQKMALAVVKLGSEMGFGPASRARIFRPSADPPAEASPWDRFSLIRGGRGDEEDEDGDEGPPPPVESPDGAA